MPCWCTHVQSCILLLLDFYHSTHVLHLYFWLHCFPLIVFGGLSLKFLNFQRTLLPEHPQQLTVRQVNAHVINSAHVPLVIKQKLNTFFRLVNFSFDVDIDRILQIILHTFLKSWNVLVEKQAVTIKFALIFLFWRYNFDLFLNFGRLVR
jgi:hypothetical protein